MIYVAKIFFLLAFGAEQFLKIPLWWKQKEAGIKWKKERSRGRKGKRKKNAKWWLTALADCIQFKNNPRAILIFISEPSTGPLGCFKCFKWNQSRTPGALRQRGERVSNKMPKTFVASSFSPLSVSLSHSSAHITVWNHTIPSCFNKTVQIPLSLHLMTPHILPSQFIFAFSLSHNRDTWGTYKY